MRDRHSTGTWLTSLTMLWACSGDPIDPAAPAPAEDVPLESAAEALAEGDAASVAQSADAAPAVEPNTPPNRGSGGERGVEEGRVVGDPGPEDGAPEVPRALPSFYDAAGMAQIHYALTGTGVPVLLQRRVGIDPVIQLDYARAHDEASAAERRAALAAEGWRDYPPEPAPELASAYALDFRDRSRLVKDATPWDSCPFLVATELEDPMDPRHDDPAARPPEDSIFEPVVCVVEPKELDAVVRRVVLARLAADRAAPCRRLARVGPTEMAELKVRPTEVVELRRHCKALLKKLRLHGPLEP